MRDEFYIPVLKHVKGNTWCIVTGFGLIPLYLADRQAAVMMDSGLKKNYRKGILELLEKENIRIGTILTSHVHPDHVGNHRVLRERYGCEICMSPFAAAYCRDPMNQNTGGFETIVRTARGYEYHSIPTDRLIDWQAPFVRAAGEEFRIVQLPGHAPEQMGFVTPDNVAYLADTILSEGIMNAIRIPYCTHVGMDLEAKARIMELNCDVYLLAHNEIREDVRELTEKNIANVHKKIDMVERLADNWMTLDQLTNRVMNELQMERDSVGKILGTKRNVQLLLNYLQENERLEIRARDGLVEYIAAKEHSIT